MKKLFFLFPFLVMANLLAISQAMVPDSVVAILKKYDSLAQAIENNTLLLVRTTQGRIRPLRTFNGKVYLSADDNSISKLNISFLENPSGNYVVYIDQGRIIEILAAGVHRYYINRKCFIQNNDAVSICERGMEELIEFEEIVTNISVFFKD